MRLIVAAGVVLLALTGCAPNTDEAYTRCTRSQLTLWQLQHPDATTDEVIDEAIVIAEACEAAAEADPQRFIDIWMQ
jgi:hypothetical protein